MLNKLKEISLAICFFIGVLTTPTVFATEANGVIQEIRVCGTGKTKDPAWVRLLAFKVEDKWFATYADRYESKRTDYDNNIHTSVVLMAFSAKHTVKVVSQDGWYPALVNCGIPTGNMLHRAAGQFISVQN